MKKTKRQKEANTKSQKKYRESNKGKAYRKKWYQDNKEKSLKTQKAKRERQRVKWHALLKVLGYVRCQVCGYGRCHQALHFHHLDHSKKKFKIADFVTKRPFNEKNQFLFLEELNKCVYLCSNCHVEREVQEGTCYV